MDPIINELAEQVRRASANQLPLRVRGSGSKDFYAYALEGEPLDTTGYRGIVDYEPTELVLTARAGTPLAEVEGALAEHGQMLACEPPQFGPDATLGGCIAAGFSGPRRAAAGSVRDFVLGVRMLDAQSEDMSFGGRVMKNVAGFDLSRLMTGSFGTLGVLLEVSLKVLPRPDHEVTVRFSEMDEARAIDAMNRWAGQPLPISATCYMQGELTVRLSGSALGVKAARAKLGGTVVDNGADFWRDVREQRLPAFDGRLWRLSVKSTTPPLGLAGSQIIEWNGSLRWLATDAPADQMFGAAHRAGGHATLFRGGARRTPIMRLDPGVLALHKRIKQALDPHGIFGPQRLHPEF